MRIYNHSNTKLAKNLRKNMTPWERKLWYLFLKSYHLKFYKQRPIGQYIVDFVCPSKKLIVELDGSQHYKSAEMQYDEERTRYLTQQGYIVVRYTNYEIDNCFIAVCEDIDQKIKNNIQN